MSIFAFGMKCTEKKEKYKNNRKKLPPPIPHLISTISYYFLLFALCWLFFLLFCFTFFYILILCHHIFLPYIYTFFSIYRYIIHFCWEIKQKNNNTRHNMYFIENNHQNNTLCVFSNRNLAENHVCFNRDRLCPLLQHQSEGVRRKAAHFSWLYVVHTDKNINQTFFITLFSILIWWFHFNLEKCS